LPYLRVEDYNIHVQSCEDLKISPVVSWSFLSL